MGHRVQENHLWHEQDSFQPWVKNPCQVEIALDWWYLYPERILWKL
jgi:hypothetical protein